MSDPPRAAPLKRDLLKIVLEDYFHVPAFDKIVHRRHWDCFETRLEKNTRKTLELLDRFDIKATFFVLGWIAEQYPEIVREVGRDMKSARGSTLNIRDDPAEFMEDLSRAREALERAGGKRILGHYAAISWTDPSDLWALDVLAEEGYAYDSSVAPIGRSFRSEPWRCFPHVHRFGGRELWEFPRSSWYLMGWQIPISGGNYFRQFPHTLVNRLVESWHRSYDAPFIMYFNVWELDPDLPRLNAASPLARIRQYRNLDKMSWVLEDYFRKYRFVGIAEYMGLGGAADLVPIPGPEGPARITMKGSEPDRGEGKTPVSIVVPCFNEELVLPFLANTLRSVQEAMREKYDVRFLFVDDGSTDDTWNSLQRIFGSRPDCTLLRHETNRGVAAAILTGVRTAETEILCSIDCDCSYDPHELKNMIPMLTGNIDMVTASPYHPQGQVLNVPKWRLAMSKTLSFLYRRVLRQKLATYTSCFRVYRRSALAGLTVREGGFLGVAEMLGKLDLKGARISEYPATLEVRLLGRSKMKVCRTILGHLGLLARLLSIRLPQGPPQDTGQIVPPSWKRSGVSHPPAQ
jgi:polysaccharide deacetylase family protein (PEP-CTERM system associated)